MPPGGVELELTLDVPGLPPGDLARGADWRDVTPSQDGDGTLALRSVKLP